MIGRTFTSVAIFLLSTLLANAGDVTVKGGEHADFTRIVVESTTDDQWRFGRTEDGYELDLGPSVAKVDLAQAFDKIPRDRVTAIWRDPQNGRLRLSLACACHAIAFEFRSGTVVIDIKPGLPPKGSSFEDPIASSGEDVALWDVQSIDQPPLPNEGVGYDWINAVRDAPMVSTEIAIPAFDLPTGSVSLDPLRKALMLQISKGAAEGIIEISNLPLQVDGSAGRVSDGPWSRVGIGELPGLKAGSERALQGSMTADGTACLKDEELDVAAWGGAGPISLQLGLARSGLLAEFDAPVPSAIMRAAHFHIFLGFGAEAHQFLDLLGQKDGKTAVLLAMSRIVDGDTPSPDPFENMETCDSAAALWAILALPPDMQAPPRSNTSAIARSFSALPPHLRQQLGGALVDRFLASGDEQTARKIRDAIHRTPTEGLPEVTLMDARFQLAEGDEEAAARLAEDAMNASGQISADAAITVVEAAFRGSRKVDPALPATLDSFLMEARGTALEAQLSRAFVLSAAMSDDFQTAFARLHETPKTFGELWSIAAEALPDDEFLIESTRHSGLAASLDRDVRFTTASRLLDLGFPDLALTWLLPISDDADLETRLLMAKAKLILRDAPAVFEVLNGVDSGDATRLRAAATTQHGDMQAAADMLFQVGDLTSGQQHLAWTQDWRAVAGEGPENWRDAASLVGTAKLDSAAGPIEKGTALVEESASARARIEMLLRSVIEPLPSQ